MSGMIGGGLSAIGGIFSWLSGRNQAARDAEQRKAGQNEVRVAVSEDALKRQVEAAKEKEKTDAEIRDTDYHRNVDRL